MGSSSVRLKVRRRKVANLAARSRQFSVKNCTIPKADKNEIIDIEYKWGIVKGTKWHGYKIPKKGYPQPKNLKVKGWKQWFTKEYKEELGCEVYERHVERVHSEYPNPQEYQKKLWKNIGQAAKMELYVQNKLKKWEKNHPKPCPNDDLFKDEFIPAWEKDREEALIRIRDFVVSMFDKLPLTGRFKTGEHKFEEEKIADIKDINGDGHKVNELDDKSKLLKKAQATVNKVHAKRTNLVAGNLRDHKRTKGRIILPKAA